MGCDIHLYLEHRINGAWESCATWTEDKYTPGQLSVDYDHQIFTDRNYHLFSLLAGVRSEDDTAPIIAPKGFPDDACALLVKEYQNDGGHTPTWITLAEFMAVDWQQPMHYEKSVEFGAYARWNSWDRAHGESPSGGWCSWTSVKTITEAEAAPIIADHLAKGGNLHDFKHAGYMGELYVRCKWSVPRYRVAERFIAKVITRMFALGKPDDVRAVFWFDNSH